MYRFMFLCGILFTKILCNGQVEYVIDSEYSEHLRNIKIDQNGDFVSLILKDSLNYNYSGGMIKFNEEFDYEIFDYNIDTADVIFEDFVVTSDNNYLVIGSIGKDNGISYYNHIIYIVVFDEDFNLLTENFYELPELYYNCHNKKLFKTKDGKIYAMFGKGSPGAVIKGFLKITENGEVINDQIHIGMGGTIMNPFPSQNSGFNILRGGEPAWAQGEITHVDTNLNLTTTILPFYINGIMYHMDLRGSCKWLNDSTYILMSEGPSSSPGQDLYLYKMNQYHEFLTEPFIIGASYQNNQALTFQGIDWTDPSHIYLAAWDWLNQPNLTPYFVAVINEDFEVLGTKSCGGDFNTAVSALMATEDGGCVMVGSRKDNLSGNEDDYDVYVAFFSPDDIITSAAETPNPYDSDYLVFPNPGKDRLVVQTALKGITLSFYNETGMLIFTHKLKDEFRNELNTAGMAYGIYFLHLTDLKGNTEIKKWIKL